MNEFNVGGFVVSTAGHDLGKCYVIFQTDSEYVYLVDGKIRTLNNIKKKKKKHIKMLDESDQIIIDKLINNTVRNEEIKRAIKLLKREAKASIKREGGKSLLEREEA